MRTRSVVMASWRSVSCLVQSAGSAGDGGASASVLLCGTGSPAGGVYCLGICAAACAEACGATKVSAAKVRASAAENLGSTVDLIIGLMKFSCGVRPGPGALCGTPQAQNFL